MPRDISVVVPAYNESDRIGETLHAIKQLNSVDEVVVVDDGSADNTYDIAREWADVVIRREHNHGKGPALDLGWRKSKGDVIVFLDADLGATAALAENLIEPVISGQCDMSVASFPPAETKGGFGVVKTLAAQGVKSLTGKRMTAPLSGQRAMRRRLLERIPPLAHGFGIEVYLTVETLRNGFRVCEIPVSFRHRETGRNVAGFVHRGKQFVHISKTLYRLWRTT